LEIFPLGSQKRQFFLDGLVFSLEFLGSLLILSSIYGVLMGQLLTFQSCCFTP